MTLDQPASSRKRLRHAGLSMLGIAGLLGTTSAYATSTASASLLAKAEPHGVEIAMEGAALRVTMPPSAWQDPAREPLSDRDFMALLPVEFGDGIIEVDVKATLAPDAPAYARGFVGVAFRVAEGKFEKIYLRPTNGPVEDMVRRNRAIQYASFPDFRFDRLRREEPGRYETAADIAPDRWLHMRIEVSGERAWLYLDRSRRPVLVVNDLKLGPDRRGRIGLWVESGTIAFFRKLKVELAPGRP